MDKDTFFELDFNLIWLVNISVSFTRAGFLYHVIIFCINDKGELVQAKKFDLMNSIVKVITPRF